MMTMLKLYELAAEYQKAFDSMEATQELDVIKAPLEQKASNVAKYIKGLSYNQTMIDDEIKRLQEMKKQLQQREKDMRDYLSFHMHACDISKIESPLFKIQFVKCPPKVEVLNEEEIPQEYKKITTTISLDKAKMRDDMKEGVVIVGAMLVQDERLEIK